jgi:hypothetical protein
MRGSQDYRGRSPQPNPSELIEDAKEILIWLDSEEICDLVWARHRRRRAGNLAPSHHASILGRQL